MEPLPAGLVVLGQAMSGVVFCARNPSGIYVATEIYEGIRRLKCPCLTGSMTPEKASDRILLCYRDFGGRQRTAIIGARSWYMCDREPNLRLDVDRELPGQGRSLWGSFIMAIAKAQDDAPDFCALDPNGHHFVRLAYACC